MKNRLSCNLSQLQASSVRLATILFAAVCLLASVPPCAVGDAPQWMHALVNVPLPAHDEKTDAVLLYSETSVNVISANKIKTVVRRAYKILWPDGREYGTVFIPFVSPGQKINGLHGWCIPAQGKDYEVKDKEAVEIALPKVDGSELITDVRDKLIRIPAPDSGNVIGYEYELEEQPLVLQDEWIFQEESPGRENHYSLQLPAGWEYKASWLNHAEVKPVQSGNNQWQWVITDVKGIREEEDMPPMKGLRGQMVVSFFPREGTLRKGFTNWREMGTWYWSLETGRTSPSDEIRQKVTALTASANTSLEKMRLLAEFVQHDITWQSSWVSEAGSRIPRPTYSITGMGIAKTRPIFSAQCYTSWGLNLIE
jgi:hypothetical protein